MSGRLGKDKVAGVLYGIFSCEKVVSETINWHRVASDTGEMVVYVAQSKPSSYGKGNWYYEFWNSVIYTTVDRIIERGARLILFDYVNRRYCVLSGDDILWVRDNSTRDRGDRGLVTDFVVVETNSGSYYLKPYLSLTGLHRLVEVVSS